MATPPPILLGFDRLVLGHERAMRYTLSGTLLSFAVYAFSLCAQWWAVLHDQADAGHAGVLSILIGVGMAGFYAAIRSGWSARFHDAALTMPQMLFALLMLQLAYLINPQVRGMLLMVVALVLVYGAFTLPPSRCRWLGWTAVALFGLAMGGASLHDPQTYPFEVEVVHFAFSLAVLPAVAVLAGQLSHIRIEQRQQKHALREAMERLQQLATRDELTGLPNRRHLLDWIARESARGLRRGQGLCLVVIDLDHFKRINDTLGHAAGDAVLARFASLAAASLREADLLARWGGEEFLIAMPGSSLTEGEAAVGRLRERLASPTAWIDCPGGPVSFSAGLTDFVASERFEQAIERADSALYEAKQQGRDRWIVRARGPVVGMAPDPVPPLPDPAESATP